MLFRNVLHKVFSLYSILFIFFSFMHHVIDRTVEHKDTVISISQIDNVYLSKTHPVHLGSATYWLYYLNILLYVRYFACY